jgi:NDP-sugar pyrophosphorylase family protein
VRFEEKCDHVGSGLVNTGVYLFDRDFFPKLIPHRNEFSLETDYFPLICGKILGFTWDNARFHDMGTPESYRMTRTFIKTLSSE